jgi:hypothetical protein
MAAGGPGVKVQFVGGTEPGLTAKTDLHIDLTSTDALRVVSGKQDFNISYGSINTVEYGQSVSRRFTEAVLISPLLILSKSHKHFVTLGYVDASGNQQALVFRVHKGDIRSVLASLEARTGRRVEYQDNEARKAGKG